MTPLGRVERITKYGQKEKSIAYRCAAYEEESTGVNAQLKLWTHAYMLNIFDN